MERGNSSSRDLQKRCQKAVVVKRKVKLASEFPRAVDWPEDSRLLTLKQGRTGQVTEADNPSCRVGMMRFVVCRGRAIDQIDQRVSALHA